MGNLVAMITGWMTAYPAFKIGMVGILTVIQGESGVILGTLLIRSEKLGWGTFFLVTGVALLLYESSVYGLGRLLRNIPLGQKIEKRIKRHKKIEKALHENSGRLLIVSRFIIYFGLAVVFLSGWTRMPYKQFIKMRAIGVALWLIIWTFVFHSLAVALGMDEKVLAEDIVIGIVIIIIMMVGMRKVVGKAVVKLLFGNGNGK
ncbi:hypothetical protein CL629_04190 [bacterium]|nr:hypothetical protein [bacterium]|tara:strand:- start:1771 stop:2379 length:609 start_codon:yes stop_codon:yes gene_type:complete